MKTILFVEDKQDTQDDYKEIFGEVVNILQATTLQKAEELFFKNPNIDLILMDGCLNYNDELDTLPLIRKIRETYKGDMVANSGSSYNCTQMVQAGCNLSWSKDYTVDNILEYIDRK